jgi:hypothetical protein
LSDGRGTERDDFSSDDCDSLRPEMIATAFGPGSRRSVLSGHVGFPIAHKHRSAALLGEVRRKIVAFTPAVDGRHIDTSIRRVAKRAQRLLPDHAVLSAGHFL